MDWTDMEKIWRKFHTNLSTSYVDVTEPQIHIAKRLFLPPLISELWNAAIQMEDEKSPGINIKLPKNGGHELWKALPARISQYLTKNIFSTWKFIENCSATRKR